MDSARGMSRASVASSVALAALLASLLHSPASAVAEVTWEPAVASMIEAVTEEELSVVVGELSGAAPALVGGAPYTFTTRSSFSGESIDKAEQYVFEHLQSYGLDSVVYQEFPGEDGAPPGRNVIGEIKGTTRADEIVVVGAHLDSYPWDVDAPGADDDASGVSATLLLAHSFAGRSFERTIRFAFFGDEENAPWECEKIGSAGYAGKCKAAGEKIVAMIEADSIAFDPPETDEPIVEMNTREPGDDADGADLAIVELWQETIDVYGIGGLVSVNVAISDNWSDHGSFWNNGYPAVMLIAEELEHSNPYWHSGEDTVDKLDWAFYAQVTRSYLAVAAHLAGILPDEPAGGEEGGSDADGGALADGGGEAPDILDGADLRGPTDTGGDRGIEGGGGGGPDGTGFGDVSDGGGPSTEKGGGGCWVAARHAGLQPAVPGVLGLASLVVIVTVSLALARLRKPQAAAKK